MSSLLPFLLPSLFALFEKKLQKMTGENNLEIKQSNVTFRCIVLEKGIQ